MREIEFRGKKQFSNEGWIYGDLIHGLDDEMYIRTIVEVDEKTKEYIRMMVDKSSVGQFTGLLDKNGKKIFEGDVIEEGVVYFDDEYLGFFVKGDFVEGERKPLYDIHLPEIIGNVTDNPELLK